MTSVAEASAVEKVAPHQLSIPEINGIIKAITQSTDLDRQLDLLQIILTMKDKVTVTLSNEENFVVIGQVLLKALRRFSKTGVNEPAILTIEKTHTLFLCLDLLILISSIKEARKLFIKYNELLEIFLQFSVRGFKFSTRLASFLINISNDLEECELLCDYKNNIVAESVLSGIIESSIDGVDSNLEPYSAVMMNMTQAYKTRKFLLSPIKDDVFTNLSMILPLASKKNMSAQVRFHLAGILKNCCFDSEFHPLLLGNEIFPSFLIQLVGPETGDQEKTNETSESAVKEAQIRFTILEALYQLCAIRKSREVLREMNVYHILRDLHTWEKSECNKDMIEDVVNLLIRTEDEIGIEDLKNLNIMDPEEKEKEQPGASGQSNE